ncbi:inositol monophosphatase [Patescibacteria group bacterium]|nr:inositol monophosphatase [Patescibacteria group bacterium]
MRNTDYPDAQYLAILALVCGDIMLKNFQLGMKKKWKSDETPLTASDVAINKLVIDRISESYPKVRIIGEEGSHEVPDAEYTVLCDPVDGTIPFSLGIPVSAFCISVIKGNQPLSAVIYDPFQKRMWVAEKGKGCRLYAGHECSVCEESPDPSYAPSNEWFPCLGGYGEPVTVSKHQTVHRSNICMVWWKNSGYELHDVCKELMDAGAKWMNPCSIAYFGGLVASGELEATIFPGNCGWETAAMQLIVEEAGGKVTDIFGMPMKYGPKGQISGHIISNGLVHDELVAMVTKVIAEKAKEKFRIFSDEPPSC